MTGKNIIGSRMSGEGKNIFYGENPSNGEKIEPGFHEATPEEINRAILAAAAAFEIYRNKSGADKASFLEAVADEIMALGDPLISRCMQETGLPEARLRGERGRTTGQLKLFASYLREGSWVEARIDHADAARTPPKADIRSMQRPLGPVGIFGASNFPFAFSVAGGDTTSALAAGCPVVFKAHPAHPGTCEMVGMAISRAVTKSGMPDGVFSMVHGRSTDVGMALVKHPAIAAIGFTGSYRGGKAIFDAANSRPVPIPVYAEMGSTNPVFILPRALRRNGAAIAKDLMASVTLGVGQFCTNPGLVVYEETNDFTESLAQSFRAAAPGVMLHAGIQDAFMTGVQKLGKNKGVTMLVEGNAEKKGCLAPAYLFQSSGAAFLKDRALEEEVFGPSTLAVTVEGKAQLVQVAMALGGHLTATLHATEEDLVEYADLVSILERKAGRLIVNGYPTGVEVTHAMVHGGPFPATTDSRTTSVGTDAIRRFSRPVCYQGFPGSLLPDALKDENPLAIWRLVNGQWTK